MVWRCKKHGKFRAEELSRDHVDNQGRPHCPNCRMIMKHLDSDKDDGETIEDIPDISSNEKKTGGGDASRTDSKRSVELSAEDMMLAKKLINAGLANDLNDVTQQALRIYGGMKFNDVIGLRDDMMNEKLIEKLTESDGDSMMDKAVALSILKGSMMQPQQNDSNGDSMDDMMKMMLMKELFNDDSKQQQQPQQGNDGMGMMEMVMMQSMFNDDSDDMSMKDILQLVKEMQGESKGGSGSDPMTMMMMMQNMQDDGDDHAMKELYELQKESKEEQTELQQQLMNERFQNTVQDLSGAIQNLKEEVDEAKEDDLDAVLGRLEKTEKLARKLGMGEEGGDDNSTQARAAERLIDSFGEHFGPALSKYFEQQAGAGAQPNGGAGGMMAQAAQQQSPQSQATVQGGVPSNDQAEIQEAQQQADQQVADENPDPSDIETW